MYIKLWDDILDSTVWMEEDHVIRVWLTFLLIANWDGFVEMPIPAIAQRARVTLDECVLAIERLQAPDRYSRTKTEEGRRIVRVTEEKTLWHIVNFEERRGLRDDEAKRKHQAAYMRDWRAKKKRGEEERETGGPTRKGEDPTPLEDPNELAHKEEDHRRDEDRKEVSSTKKPSSSRKDDGAFVKKVLQYWEANALQPRAVSISKARRAAILARRREHGKDAVWKALENRAKSNFLNHIYNDGRGAPIDWVFGPKNFAKVVDGNFNEGPKRPRGKTNGTETNYDSVL